MIGSNKRDRNLTIKFKLALIQITHHFSLHVRLWIFRISCKESVFLNKFYQGQKERGLRINSIWFKDIHTMLQIHYNATSFSYVCRPVCSLIVVQYNLSLRVHFYYNYICTCVCRLILLFPNRAILTIARLMCYFKIYTQYLNQFEADVSARKPSSEPRVLSSDCFGRGVTAR